MRGRNTSSPRNDLPGPGNYNPLDSLTKLHTPSTKIAPMSSLQIQSTDKLPGPGYYDQHSNFGKGLAYKMSGRTSPQKMDDIPGPGSYDAKVDVVKASIGNVKIGKNKRDFLQSFQQDLSRPGPG